MYIYGCVCVWTCLNISNANPMASFLAVEWPLALGSWRPCGLAPSPHRHGLVSLSRPLRTSVLCTVWCAAAGTRYRVRMHCDLFSMTWFVLFLFLERASIRAFELCARPPSRARPPCDHQTDRRASRGDWVAIKIEVYNNPSIIQSLEKMKYY